VSILHDIKLGLEIYGLAAGGLVLASFMVAQLRHLLDRNQKTFTYPQDVLMAEQQASEEGYLHRCLVALDIFMNVVFFVGRHGETMSSDAWIASLNGKLWGRAMNFWLNGFQAQHGPQAASGDLWRSQVEVNRLRKILDL
jgi:hypothetical protein